MKYSLGQGPYSAWPADCGAGWRIIRYAKNGDRRQLVGKTGRPRHFRTHAGAADEVMRLNREYLAKQLKK